MTTRHHTTAGAGTERLTVETWGDGTPVVLVHGSLAFGAEEWSAQQPLAERGFELTVYDRRGYGHNAGAAGEDFLADADDIAELLGDGAHLVGHSYGGLGAMIAAARRPDATLSLTLLEAPAGGLAVDDSAWARLETEVRAMWTADLPDREWVVAFLTAVGSNPEEFPEEFLDAAVELDPGVPQRSPVLRRGAAVRRARGSDLPQAGRVGRASRGLRRDVPSARPFDRRLPRRDRRRRPRDPVRRRAPQRPPRRALAALATLTPTATRDTTPARAGVDQWARGDLNPHTVTCTGT